ncbi:hypothetical protein BHM03_00019593 [Ensete ventricosum]|nr:hypothetical protein BHM03_00019593 [Ensete ventricosum]
MALILLFQGCLFGGKAWRDRSMSIGSAAARAQGCCRCRTMEAAAADAAADLRSDFLQVLRSRRRNPDGMHLVMEACPKENVENFKEGLIEENIYLTTEGFRWALDNDKWHARVDSIKPVFEGQLASYQFHILDHGYIL